MPRQACRKAAGATLGGAEAFSLFPALVTGWIARHEPTVGECEDGPTLGGRAAWSSPIRPGQSCRHRSPQGRHHHRHREADVVLPD